MQIGPFTEFHIFAFAPPNAAPCTVPPGVHAPLTPPAATEENIEMCQLGIYFLLEVALRGYSIRRICIRIR